MKSPDRPESNSESIWNQLLDPSYVHSMEDSNGELIKWIGVESKSIDGKQKKFLLWRNYKLDISDAKDRKSLATFIAVLKVIRDTDTVVGKPVDLGGSDPDQNFVDIINEPQGVGLYVEAEKRNMFNFFIHFDRLPNAEELEGDGLIKFENAYSKVLLSLPGH